MRPKRTDAWFGLNDIVDEGVFEFADGSPRGSYSNFLSGQGTSQYQDGVGEDCCYSPELNGAAR